jgi:hypothetical protein
MDDKTRGVCVTAVINGHTCGKQCHAIAIWVSVDCFWRDMKNMATERK